MEIRVSMRQTPDGRWAAWTVTEPNARASGPTRDRCLTGLRRAIERSLRAAAPDGPGAPVSLLVEALPQLAGVAEAAEIMGWDKRRVITYIDRGSFPEPVQALASGRVWLREDVERFAREWRTRQAARLRAGVRGREGARSARAGVGATRRSSRA